MMVPDVVEAGLYGLQVARDEAGREVRDYAFLKQTILRLQPYLGGAFRLRRAGAATDARTGTEAMRFLAFADSGIGITRGMRIVLDAEVLEVEDVQLWPNHEEAIAVLLT